MMKSCSTMNAVFLACITNRLITCSRHLASREAMEGHQRHEIMRPSSVAKRLSKLCTRRPHEISQ